MNRAFDSLTGVGTHGEPASGDLNSQRLSDWHANGDYSHSEPTLTSVYKMLACG